VIKQDSNYVTTLSTVPYTDAQTVVFLKKEVMMVLSNAGSAGEQYTITIPMQSAAVNTAGTEYTDIIACGKVKIASTGDFVTTIVNGMPQVEVLPNDSNYRYGFHRHHWRRLDSLVVFLLAVILLRILLEMKIRQRELTTHMAVLHTPLLLVPMLRGRGSPDWLEDAHLKG
jgi:Domain of unknown function (DUF1966)